MDRLRELLRTPIGWFVVGLVEFLLVVAVLGAVLPEGWPPALQGGIAIGAFVGLVAFNLWWQRRMSRRG